MQNELRTTTDNTEYVGFSKRLLAYNIDITVLMIPFIISSLFIESNAILFSLCFVIVCAYHTILESSRWQGTFGKQYNQIMVIDQNGKRISFITAFARVLLKFVSLMLMFSGFIMIYFRRDRRGLHDLILKTYVVFKK